MHQQRVQRQTPKRTARRDRAEALTIPRVSCDATSAATDELLDRIDALLATGSASTTSC